MNALDVHRYRLAPRGAGPAREGALLRVTFEDGVAGYGDLHPWTELGDAPLAEQLDRLRDDSPSALAQRSLATCARDGDARRRGVSLFADRLIPESHWTLSSLDTDDGEIERATALGFHRFKAKIVPSDTVDTQLRSLLARLPADALLRLDANGRFTVQAMAQLLRSLHDDVSRLDFLEDPTANGDEWFALERRFAVSCATDFVAAPDPHVIVVKPARDAVAPLLATGLPERWVFTSYLDHPVGQLHAASAAADALHLFPDWIDVCGLTTHFVYETNAFSELLRTNGARLVPPAGAGIGFEEDFWRTLAWTRLRS